MGAKILMFERVDFYAYIEFKLTVDRVQVENSVPFPLVTTFKTAGTYKK